MANRGIPDIFSTENPHATYTYTDFKKIKTLEESDENRNVVKFYELMYGVDQQRRKSVYTEGDTEITRYYLGDYEEEINSDGNTRKIHYLRGGGIFIQENGQESLFYAYTDHLGSLTALTNEAGDVIERYAFDPWGNRRNPTDWTQSDNRFTWKLNRGFTGHEHIDQFGIINMNGRVYDPVTSQFFSPDPFVQAPGNWLNYNRYAYAYGNPLRYTDPNGEFIVEALVIASMAYFGGMQANFAYTSNNGTNMFNPGNWNWGSASTYIGIAGGAMSGAGMVGLYIPSLNTSGMFTNGALQAGVQVTLNGIGNVTDDRKFFDGWYWAAGRGFLSGAVAGYELAKDRGLNVWTGMGRFDLTQGYAASGAPIPEGTKTITGRYVGKIEDVNVYESKMLGTYNPQGGYSGVTIPERGIIVGKGVYKGDWDMMKHEFGHILQYRIHGANAYWNVIAAESLNSATFHVKDHYKFWTETYANYLSFNHFHNKYWNGFDSFDWDYRYYPIKNISLENLSKLMILP